MLRRQVARIDELERAQRDAEERLGAKVAEQETQLSERDATISGQAETIAERDGQIAALASEVVTAATRHELERALLRAELAAQAESCEKAVRAAEAGPKPECPGPAEGLEPDCAEVEAEYTGKFAACEAQTREARDYCDLEKEALED